MLLEIPIVILSDANSKLDNLLSLGNQSKTTRLSDKYVLLIYIYTHTHITKYLIYILKPYHFN